MEEVLPSVNFKRSSIKKLTESIDKVVEGLSVLESPSKREVHKEMTITWKKIGTISENIQRNDLNPNAFQANRAYKMSKDKIKAYIDQTYRRSDIKDDNRLTEILQNRPLTTFFQHSTKLLFNSLDEAQIHDIIASNKRKFGECWNMTPKTNRKDMHIELSPITRTKKSEYSPRNKQLSVLIKDLLVKKLGIKTVQKNENTKERFASSYYSHRKNNNTKVKSLTENIEEIVIPDEKDYLGPEYAKYISDVPNQIKIQKYIGINSGKQRRMNKQLARLSRL